MYNIKFKIKHKLSAQQLISCESSNGGNNKQGWEYLKNNELVTGGIQIL